MPPISGPIATLRPFFNEPRQAATIDLIDELEYSDELEEALKHLYLEQARGLSSTGRIVLRGVYRQVSKSLHEDGYVPMTIILGATKCRLQPSTYVSGVEELLKKEYILSTHPAYSPDGPREEVFIISSNKLNKSHITKKLEEIRNKRSESSVRKLYDSPQSSKTYNGARIDAGIVTMAVSLPWLAFAVFHSPFLTAFFASTALLSAAALVGPAQIQAASRNLKEVFRAAGNKIRASSPAKKAYSNTIQIRPSPMGLERPTQGDEVHTSLPLLSKDFSSIVDDTQNEALSPTTRGDLTAAKRKGFNL